eukprot:SAG31_NODE_1216_length_9328_cov_12.252465_10_plen_146_part_00
MTWQLEYVAKEYFELQSMRSSAWEQLHQRFLVNDTAFQKFAAVNYVMYDLKRCIGNCKAVMICGLFAVTTPAHEACVKSFGYASGAKLQRVWLTEGGALHAALTHKAGAADSNSGLGCNRYRFLSQCVQATDEQETGACDQVPRS